MTYKINNHMLEKKNNFQHVSYHTAHFIQKASHLGITQLVMQVTSRHIWDNFSR